MDSMGALGSSPGRSFLALEIAYLSGLVREAQKRETGSIESEGDLRDGSGCLGPESVISENLCFHLIHRFLTFTRMSSPA